MNIGTYIAAGIAFILAAIILYAFVDRICTCIERRRLIERIAPGEDLGALLDKIKEVMEDK